MSRKEGIMQIWQMGFLHTFLPHKLDYHSGLSAIQILPRFFQPPVY